MKKPYIVRFMEGNGIFIKEVTLIDFKQIKAMLASIRYEIIGIIDRRSDIYVLAQRNG